MAYLHPQAEEAAARYLGNDKLEGPLGSGIDGIVYSTSRGTAVKVNSAHHLHANELAVYLRLQANGVRSLNGLSVPQLLGWDNKLKVIEMSIVRPPYVIDFAKSRVDRPPDFPSEAMEEWQLKME